MPIKLCLRYELLPFFVLVIHVLFGFVFYFYFLLFAPILALGDHFERAANTSERKMVIKFLGKQRRF